MAPCRRTGYKKKQKCFGDTLLQILQAYERSIGSCQRAEIRNASKLEGQRAPEKKKRRKKRSVWVGARNNGGTALERVETFFLPPPGSQIAQMNGSDGEGRVWKTQKVRRVSRKSRVRPREKIALVPKEKPIGIRGKQRGKTFLV